MANKIKVVGGRKRSKHNKIGTVKPSRHRKMSAGRTGWVTKNKSAAYVTK